MTTKHIIVSCCDGCPFCETDKYRQSNEGTGYFCYHNDPDSREVPDLNSIPDWCTLKDYEGDK